MHTLTLKLCLRPQIEQLEGKKNNGRKCKVSSQCQNPLTWYQVVLPLSSLVTHFTYVLTGRLSRHKSKTATLLRPDWGFSKQNLLRLPSARDQVTGLVWKSSDEGQQMHRKCFWSNKMAWERGGMEGKKWVWLWLHVRLTTSMCLCFRVRVDEHWMSRVWGIFWHHRQVSYNRDWWWY